jgi:DEAD/DEAH box helicase domain-containing protein
VLDEAHTYIGSKAAELALLLRRVMMAFGVRAEEVHFVATSATLGGSDVDIQLQRYLATLAGVPLTQVHVVKGERDIPGLIKGHWKHADKTLDELESLKDEPPGRLYRVLSGNIIARAIRNAFLTDNGCRPRPLSSMQEIVSEDGDELECRQVVLRWLDLLTHAKNESGLPFLPLRLHAFQGVFDGLWACSEKHCYRRSGTALDVPNWPFGKVYTVRRSHCECGARVFELRSCDYCHSVYLWAAWKNEDGRWLIRQSVSGDDDFSTGKEPEESESIPAIQTTDTGWQPILIHNEGEAAHWMDFVDADNPGHYGRACRLGADRMVPRQPLVCRSCGREHRHNRPVFQSLRLSAPVLQEALLPVLLRHAAPCSPRRRLKTPGHLRVDAC